MQSRSRLPWWWCARQPHHVEFKRRFHPTPSLSGREWQAIGPPLAAAMGFTVVRIDCVVCHDFIEDGMVLHGYRRSAEARYIYAFDALPMHLGARWYTEFGSAYSGTRRQTYAHLRDRRLAIVGGLDGRTGILCWRCWKRAGRLPFD